MLAMVAGCGSFRVPTADDLIPQTPKFELKTLPNAPVRKLGPPALVGPDGSCAATGVEPEFAGSGIALQMSECDVVQRAGPPQDVQISANARGQRLTVLTYAGERAGVYRFVAGRLASMERGPEPPAPEAPAKKKPAKKSSKSAKTSAPSSPD